VTVSAPWFIASQGHVSYRFLPQLASVLSTGRQILVVTALLAAMGTVLAARVTAKGASPLPQEVVPACLARLAAAAGTVVIALSLVVLSHQSVAATIQRAFTGGGLLAEPGDLLRQWLLLGAWASPAGAPLGDWLLYRAADVLLLAVVWWALRRLPGLLTRATVPAMAVGAVCATVLGLLASQLLRMATDGTGMRWGLMYLSAGLGGGVPAALTWGLVSGVTAAVTLRVAVGRTKTADAAASVQDPPGRSAAGWPSTDRGLVHRFRALGPEGGRWRTTVADASGKHRAPVRRSGTTRTFRETLPPGRRAGAASLAPVRSPPGARHGSTALPN
jgi:hypothetical protein